MAEDFFDRLAKGAPPAAKGGGDFFDRLSKAPPPKAASVPLATMDIRKGLPTMRDNAPVPRKVGFEALPSLEQVDKYMGVAPGQSLLDGRQIISRSLHAAKDGLGLVDRGARAVVGDDAVNAISDPANLMIPGIGQLGAALKMGSSVTKTRVAPTVARIAEQAPLTAATGAAIAAKKLLPVVQKVQAAATSTAQNILKGGQARQIARQYEKSDNPGLVKGVVADLEAAYKNNPGLDAKGKPIFPKGRANLDVEQINSVRDGYLDGVKRELQGLDLPPSRKNALLLAIEQKHTIGPDAIKALRTDVAGNAVADGITKTQILKKMTPEVPVGGMKAMLHSGLTATAAALPVLAAGPIGLAGALPAAKAASWLGRKLAISGEASRAASGSRLVDLGPKYAKEGAKFTDPQVASRAALTDAYNTTVDGAYVGAKTDASTKAAFGDAFPNAGIRDPKVRVDPATGASTAVVARLKALEPKSSSALDAFDKKMAAADKVDAKATDARTTAQAKDLMATTRGPIDDPYRPTAKQTLANFKRETGFDPAKVDSKLASFDAALDTPLPPPVVKVPKTKALSAAEQGMADNIAKGIPGNTGTQAYFGKYVLGSEAAPVSAADAVRAAEAVAGDYPQFAGEIAKFKGGYNTVKGFKQVVGPAMRKYLETDGTLAKVQAASELANKTATARKAAESVRNATKKATGAKATEAPAAASAPPPGAAQSNGGGSNYSVGSRADFERARTENIDKANKLKDDLYGDIRLSEDLFKGGELDGFMETLRDLKFSDKANAYLEQHLDGMKGVASAKELSIISGYGKEVIAMKKHASQAALDEAMAPRTRGRPRK